eukprot:67949_1
MVKGIVMHILGKKLEWIIVNGTTKPPATTAGWMEIFDGGKIDIWNYAGNILLEGTYTLTEADNNQECYLLAQYPDNRQECITFSPTLDHHSIVGCFVWTDQCVPVCANSPKT